ncbi:MAG: IS630 family transposase [Planctomycetales bacterium]|nr:IS630 family transposase [Planctomycetales bacterium]
MWCIPPEQNAAFVAAMEHVLAVYQRPHDPRFPVVNMDEQPFQLISESRSPLPMQPGQTQKVDFEYIREGSCNIWMFVEALSGWRDVLVTETKTAVDWAHRIRELVNAPRFAEAERITLVCDNLNTHTIASLYQAFGPEEAFRIANRIEIVHTPKHGSWLNMAEPELSVLTRQCFTNRVNAPTEVARRCTAWATDRNERQKGIDWRFTNDQARTKLKRLYPKIEL